MKLLEFDKSNLVATMDGYLDIDVFCREIARRLISRLNVRSWHESPLSPMVDLYWWNEPRPVSGRMRNTQHALSFSEMADMFLEDEQ
jgi:hypothetical protein